MDNISSLLKTFKCNCGKIHSCPIEYVYVEKNVSKRLPKILEKYNKILLVADENTYGVYGTQVENALKNKSLIKQIFGAELLVPDENAVKKVIEKSNGIEIIVGIGSGVIQDLCKYVSFNLKIEYMVVATAPSMDGYASSGAAMLINGLKITYSAHTPKALLADTDVIKNAPYEMIESGYGDIVGKFSSLNDWKLANVINGEYFCQYVYDLTMNILKEIVNLRFNIKNREEKAVKFLMEALIAVGVAMSYVGNSRPASGSEHHISHYFEVSGVIFKNKYLAHGTDVAFATILTAKMRERILNADWLKQEIKKQDRVSYISDMKKAYGKCADDYIALQDKADSYGTDRIKVYLNNEKEIRKVLAEMPSHSYIKQILKDVGLTEDIFNKTYPQEKVDFAVQYAKDLKDRFSVLWLNYDFFYPNVTEGVNNLD